MFKHQRWNLQTGKYHIVHRSQRICSKKKLLSLCQEEALVTEQRRRANKIRIPVFRKPTRAGRLSETALLTHRIIPDAEEINEGLWSVEHQRKPVPS